MKKLIFCFLMLVGFLSPSPAFAVVRPVQSPKIETVKKPEKHKTKKRQWVAFALCFFFGCLGVHRFYLGYNFLGVVYLLTAGLFGVGWLIDLLLLIIPGGILPKGEKSY